MRPLKETGLKINRDRLNTKSNPEALPPESPISKAISLLTAEGEPPLRLDQVTVIPIEVDKGFSVAVLFQGNQGDKMGPKKGTNVHTLRVQRTEDTQIPPGNLTSEKSLGYDVEENGLVGIVNSRRPTFFHPTELIVSEETTLLPITPDTTVDVPLYVPVPFQGENGKGVVVVTRYPADRINIEKSDTLEKPRGQVDPGANVLRRKNPIVAPERKTSAVQVFDTPPAIKQEPQPTTEPVSQSTSFQSELETHPSDTDAFSEERFRPPSEPIMPSELPPVSQTSELTGQELDNAIQSLVKNWNSKRYSALLGILQNPNPTIEERKLALRNFDIRLDNAGDYAVDHLFTQVATRIVSLQESYENSQKINGPQYEYKPGFLGRGGSWVVNTDQLKLERDQLEKSFSDPQNHTEATYVEFMSRWFLLNHKWAQ